MSPALPPDTVQLTGVILVLDVVESVRLMEVDESGYILRWQRFVREIREEVLPAFAGRIHKSTGDGLLIEFSGPLQAIQAAFGMQRSCAAANAELRQEDQLHLRIAAHFAQFVADEYDIYGCGVNLAYRLLQLATPDEICISADLRTLLGDGIPARVVDCGMHRLRHVRDPVHVYKVQLAECDAATGNARLPAAV
ncbi:adenylate/guanylate cyclase domain-containing protein [Ramlibacter tataouinensis]|uniref:adenylate/guanylate cyclase domain-containing protein n=1 Tax=Ramlibacter tataouinensis TaxID=94132 RepID=UPI0022F3BDA0|nr:adenylate/guanylate cyclase domain-containing protein [Ramlibacter tataouinensis]WBY00426.1 adenylate/guanylate cyclase domain-containing protein [Ramlibacter tataouinensis]